MFGRRVAVPDTEFVSGEESAGGMEDRGQGRVAADPVVAGGQGGEVRALDGLLDGEASPEVLAEIETSQ